MSSTDLYTQILGLQSPWHIDRVELDEGSQQVLVFVRKSGSEQLACPPEFDTSAQKSPNFSPAATVECGLQGGFQQNLCSGTSVSFEALSPLY